jgi:hypothetical protein
VASNASRGAAAKGRTKAWLLERGYQVADLEVVRWMFGPGGRVPVKRDQFGSDLLAMSATEIVFVQVKSGATAAGGTFPEARRAFAAVQFPIGVRRLIIAWPPRARAPRIIELLGSSFTVRTLTQQRRSQHGKEESRQTVKEAGAGQGSYSREEFERDSKGETGDRLAEQSRARTQTRPAVATAPGDGKRPEQAPR